MGVCNANNLIWIDLEMTGLDPNDDRIIEIATVITDSDLNIVAEGPVLAIQQSKARLDQMDSWNTKQHNHSGLVNRVQESPINETQAEAETIQFLQQYVPAGKSPICGNSICQDRRFLAHYMPKLERYFHYRHLDVSTLKILAQRWAPQIANGFSKHSTHLALQDIYDSIDELKYYRALFLRLPSF